jgi:hypothetical protein
MLPRSRVTACLGTLHCSGVARSAAQPQPRRCRIDVLAVLRRAAAVLFALLVGGGLLAGGRLSDARWLAVLGVGGLLLLVAVWPELPRGVLTTARTTVRLGVLLAVAFLLIAVQLFRIQVVQRGGDRGAGRAGPGDRGGDRQPRTQVADLAARRGRVFDRRGRCWRTRCSRGDGAPGLAGTGVGLRRRLLLAPALRRGRARGGLRRRAVRARRRQRRVAGAGRAARAATGRARSAADARRRLAAVRARAAGGAAGGGRAARRRDGGRC